MLISTCTKDYSDEKSFNRKRIKSNNSQKATNFRDAKKILIQIYKDHKIDFYCNCKFDQTFLDGYSILSIDPSCGLEARNNLERISRLEWEHIVPAFEFGKSLSCWNENICEKNGISFKGRKCCRRIDEKFALMESDMHNLQPVPGEINADRNYFYYGEIDGEKRNYGTCDFEVDSKKKLAEPRSDIRGDIARTYFYMEKEYNIEIHPAQKEIYIQWDKLDPPDDWEKERNIRIEKIQGNFNSFINR